MLDFYKGMDISGLPELEDGGTVLRDREGHPRDAFALAAEYGVNAIRLRLWNDPGQVPASGGYCDLAHTIAMAKRIRAQGMSFLLDFHYSDWWADPGKQTKPKAWEGLSFRELERAVFDYTRGTLLTLKEEGVLPDMVQIGNEIRSGLLFPEGELPDYEGMTKLVNAGIRGARAAAGEDLQVMIHLDQGGRYFYLHEWFEKAFGAGLEDFDVIGLSYYPFWHGNFTDLKNTLEQLVKDYHKPVLIVETAHAWRLGEHGFIDEAQERIAGVPATPAGQEEVLRLVMDIVASLPDKKGRGIYYWEPFCVPREGRGGWSENMGLLDETGRALEGIRAFRFVRESREVHERRIYQPKLERGGEADRPVQSGENLLRNTNWDEDLEYWDVEVSREGVMLQRYPEFLDPFPAPPRNAVRVEAVRNFHFTLSQEVEIPEAGDYCLKCRYKGADTTGVEVHLFLREEGRAEDAGSTVQAVIHPTEHEWQEARVCARLEPGRCTVGLCIAAPPVYGMVKEFGFYKTEAAQ